MVGFRVRNCKEKNVYIVPKSDLPGPKPGIQGKRRRARRELRRALKDDPYLIPALRLAADLAIDSGNPNDAVQWNERLRAVTKNSPDSIIRLSETLEQSGQAKEALSYLRKTVQGEVRALCCCENSGICTWKMAA